MIYFIADIHLSPKIDDAINQHFLSFLHTKALQADTLYILGDLFDGWLGDDMGLVMYAPIIQALHDYTQTGRTLFVGLGNRDFLLKSDFAKATGAQLLADEVEISLGNHRAVILHGDTLCTDDHAYLALRNMVQNPEWQAWALSLAPAERLANLAKMKDQSATETALKSNEIMDVTDTGVTELFNRHPTCNIVIHGHTHRPMVHDLDNNKQRWVLGDWQPNARICSWDGSCLTLEHF
jgi:UDP-2,3-diacylglucosamine hydrolase